MHGGKGAIDLAHVVAKAIEENPSKPLKFAYEDNDDIKTKISNVCMNIYGAARVTYAKSAENMINRIKELGLENYPVCIAKTQYSFSADPKAYGIPEGFDIRIRDLVINRGAEMIVAIAGDILRMPGLPSSPQAERIDIIDGQIEGLS
jgi:formate--tetrahydrofolate ligase